MIIKKYIGGTIYVKTLDSTITITDDATRFKEYKACGLGYIFENVTTRKKPSKHTDADTDGESDTEQP